MRLSCNLLVLLSTVWAVQVSAVDNDSKLLRAVVEDHQTALASALSESDAPRDAFVAALLLSAASGPLTPAAASTVAREAADQKRRALLVSAVERGWDDPELLMLAVTSPTHSWGLNAELRARSIERLLALQPGNPSSALGPPARAVLR